MIYFDVKDKLRRKNYYSCLAYTWDNIENVVDDYQIEINWKFVRCTQCSNKCNWTDFKIPSVIKMYFTYYLFQSY
jgi:hypothetical protein